MADEHQVCTFYLHGGYFGLDVLNVQEIIRYQEMTRVPLASPVVGLINLRGQIVTALDLRRLLELPDRSAEEQPVNVVVQTEDQRRMRAYWSMRSVMSWWSRKRPSSALPKHCKVQRQPFAVRTSCPTACSSFWMPKQPST